MSAAADIAPDPAAENAALRTENAALREQLDSVQQQLETFRKLLFGARSEKRTAVDLPGQGELFDRPTPVADEAPKKPVKAHGRGTAKKGFPDGCVNAQGLRFDDSVPVTTIRLEPEGIEGLSPDDYEVIDTERRYRLGQSPSSYRVICYELPVIKRRADGQILPVATVPAVLEGSVAEVSLLAGLLSDKFVSHLPLYRQHQRLEAAGVTLARSTLTNLVRRSIDLLMPIAEAQWRHALASKVLAMDETPIKAGRSKKTRGRMHQGYFWPIYGEDDEICFVYAGSRARRVIEELLAKEFEGTLLTDGYGAYASFVAAEANVVHAQCWSHARRKFVEAAEAEPVLVERMLELFGVLYRIEADLREAELGPEEIAERRRTLSTPVVDQIVAFAAKCREDPSLLPRSPFSKALAYLENRIEALRVFLTDPAVAIDTNHLERGIRPIAMGRRNWLFCWTELGAEHVGVIQSLISTCRLHGVDPYTYLVDVLQRVGEHRASEVIELTPRVWKERFGHAPLGSVLTGSG